MEHMSSLGNALRLLSMFGESSPRMRVTDIAAATGLPKSSVSRLLKELCAAGYVERDGDSRAFRTGPEFFRLGALYSKRVPFEDRIDETCRRLIAKYPATAYVGVLRGLELIVIRRHEGWHPVRYIQEPGSSLPAFATAVGKALLAHLPDGALEDVLPDRMSTPFREADYERQELVAELRESRGRGYALMVDLDIRIGATGVAVSLSPGRSMGFAICYGLDSITDEEKQILAGELTSAAREIGNLTADPYWT